MITKEQCQALRYGATLHYTGRHNCNQTIGARGAIKETITHVRKSGECKTWKRNINRFYMPVKYGLYENAYIDQNNCQDFHLETDCPLRKEK
jgi:hypothetical protein